MTRALKHALGFSDDELSQVASIEPYVEYIKASWTGRGKQEDFLRFFIEVVQHFRDTSDERKRSEDSSIRGYLDGLIAQFDHYYFNDTIAQTSARISRVNDTVLLVLGTWLLSKSYFVPATQDQRRIVYAYCRATSQEYSEDHAFRQSIAGLLSTSGLLPNPRESDIVPDGNDGNVQLIAEVDITEAFPLHSCAGDVLESLSIDANKLNAINLSTYSRIEIAWTQNLSRHMLLSKRAESYYLEVFALPCALQDGAGHVFSRMGISSSLIDEIECSYATLFNPCRESTSHKTLASLFGLHRWCWCLYCAAYRFRKRTWETLRERKVRQGRTSSTIGPKSMYDDRIRVLMEHDASTWNQTDFGNLWPRILVLDAHLQRARPWNFWVLFRDRRDTVQYWTFLFGTAILLLTVLQVILSIAQVVGSFE